MDFGIRPLPKSPSSGVSDEWELPCLTPDDRAGGWGHSTSINAEARGSSLPGSPANVADVVSYFHVALQFLPPRLFFKVKKNKAHLNILPKQMLQEYKISRLFPWT